MGFVLSNAAFSSLGKTLTLPALAEPADPARHVFMPLSGYDKKVSDLFTLDKTVFIRAGVATGKSTLAKHLASELPEKYVLVPFSSGSESSWTTNIIKVIEQATGNMLTRSETCLEEALQLAVTRSLTLVLDEAHTIFNSANLCTVLFKADRLLRPNILLFSAAGEAATPAGESVATPSEITQKFIWTPPMPDARVLKEPLEKAGVALDVESILFFLHFCGSHRGIFIAAMRWVQSVQKDIGDGTIWTLGKTVGMVRDSHGEEDWGPNTILGHMVQSRAIRVNGRFAMLSNIPGEFARLLCEGPKVIDDVWRRKLTINGFVLPDIQPGQLEFQLLDWTNRTTKYRVANPWLATYYQKYLATERGLQWSAGPMQPTSCIDLLLRAIPYLTFSKVTGYPPGTEQDSPLSPDGLPYEDQYNAAIIAVLNQLKFKAAAALDSAKGLGKIDIYVRLDGVIYGMEVIMAARTSQHHVQHRNQFDELKRYKEPTQKALIIIGKIETVRLRVEETRADGVEIIGLAPNLAHSDYTVLLKKQDFRTGDHLQEFSLRCDLVARGLVTKDGNSQVSCVQEMIHIHPPASGSAEQQPGIVWVKELRRCGDSLELAGNAFPIDSLPQNIAYLKKAVVSEEKLSVAASTLDIYLLKDGMWVKCDVDAVVHGTSRTDCYGYTLPL